MKFLIFITFALAVGSSVGGPLGLGIPFFGSETPVEPPKNLTDEELLVNAIVELTRLLPEEQLKKIIASVDWKIDVTGNISKEMFANSTKEQLCLILDKMLTKILGVSDSALRSRIRKLSRAAQESIMYSLQPVIYVKASLYNKINALLSPIRFIINSVKGATNLAVNSVTGTVHAVQNIVQAANTINNAVNHPIQTAGSAVSTVADAVSPVKVVKGAVNFATGTISEARNNTRNRAKNTVNGITNQIAEAADCERIVSVASDLKDAVSDMTNNAAGLAYDQASKAASGAVNIATAPLRMVFGGGKSKLTEEPTVQTPSANDVKTTTDKPSSNQIENKDTKNATDEVVNSDRLAEVANELKDTVSDLATIVGGLAYDQAANAASGAMNIATAPLRMVFSGGKSKDTPNAAEPTVENPSNVVYPVTDTPNEAKKNSVNDVKGNTVSIGKVFGIGKPLVNSKESADSKIVNHSEEAENKSAANTVTYAVNTEKRTSGVSSLTGETTSEVEKNSVSDVNDTINEAVSPNIVTDAVYDLKGAVSHMTSNAAGLAYDQASKTASGAMNIATAPIRMVFGIGKSNKSR